MSTHAPLVGRPPAGPTEGNRMLVLSLKIGEKVMIGDDIEVQLLELRGGQARLGFLAPRDVEVNRLKIWQRKRAQRRRETRT